jgi:hypothetical protein
VVVNRISANEQLRRDFPVRSSFRGKLGNLTLLWSEFSGCIDGSASGLFAGGSKLEASPLGESLRSHGRKLLICQAKLGAGVASSFATP